MIAALRESVQGIFIFKEGSTREAKPLENRGFRTVCGQTVRKQLAHNWHGNTLAHQAKLCLEPHHPALCSSSLGGTVLSLPITSSTSLLQMKGGCCQHMCINEKQASALVFISHRKACKELWFQKLLYKMAILWYTIPFQS